MSTYRTEGIVLRRSHFGEAHLLLSILTRERGKVEAVARSARKAQGKLKGHLEPFLYSDFVLVRGKKMDTVANSFILQPFLRLRTSLNLSLTAAALVEMAERMTVEDARDERAFDLLCQALEFLESTPEEEAGLYLLLLFFEVNLLSLSGFAPQADRCVFCSQKLEPGNNRFSFSLGGLLCGGCAARVPDALPVADDVIRLLRFLSVPANEPDYAAATGRKLEEMRKLRLRGDGALGGVRLMKGFIEFNIDRRINALDVLYGFAREGI